MKIRTYKTKGNWQIALLTKEKEYRLSLSAFERRVDRKRIL